MGYWWRNQHELLLVGTRCSFSPPSEDLRLSSVFFEPRTAHSMKPDAIADAIAGMFPNLTKIELFSRQPREGWAAWGNEITNAEILRSWLALKKQGVFLASRPCFSCGV